MFKIYHTGQHNWVPAFMGPYFRKHTFGHMPAYGDLLQISRHICRVEWASIDRPFVGLDLVNILLQNEGYM